MRVATPAAAVADAPPRRRVTAARAGSIADSHTLYERPRVEVLR